MTMTRRNLLATISALFAAPIAARAQSGALPGFAPPVIWLPQGPRLPS